MAARAVWLRKHCPKCGGAARAEAKLPGSPGPRPTEFDLDDLSALADKHSLGLLLAVVELLPYKQFSCGSCGQEFRLANDTAKEMVIGMLAAMRPVSEPAAKTAKRRSGARQAVVTRAATPPLPLPAVALPPAAPIAAHAPGAEAPLQDSLKDDWEPESLG